MDSKIRHIKTCSLTFEKNLLILMNKFLPVIVALLSVMTLSSFRHKGKPKKYVVIGYVGGYRGLVNFDSIDVRKLTHINYAFVDCQGGRAFLHNLATDTVSLRRLAAARLRNPSLQVLISIGG